MHGAGQWLTPGPAKMPSAPQGQLLSHGPRMFGQSKWKLLAEPASTSSALLTNTRLACSLTAGDSSWSPVCLSLKGQRGRKNQQSGRLARTEEPSPMGPLGMLHRWPAPNITSPQRCHRGAERTREWYTRPISKQGVPGKEYQQGEQPLWGLPQHHLSVHAQRESWAALTLTWKHPGRTPPTALCHSHRF